MRKDVQDAVDATTSKTAIKKNIAAQIARKSTALHKKAAKNTKEQNNQHALSHMQWLAQKTEKKDKKEHKKASDAQTQIENNL